MDLKETKKYSTILEEKAFRILYVWNCNQISVVLIVPW